MKKSVHPLKAFGGLAAISLMISPMTWWATFCILMPLSTYLFVEAFAFYSSRKYLLMSRNLFIVIMGTQLIFPASLPAFLSEYPRLANPNWVYLFYLIWEFLPAHKKLKTA